MRSTVPDTAHARRIFLDVPGWPGHLAGQHVDVRLTAEDGYQAQRSYSIASAPEAAELELLVERIDDGEVSPYLTEELREGDEFELRGPIGGYFTWRSDRDGDMFLVGGGSGVVPLVSILRHHAAIASPARAGLLLSARTMDDVLYRDELEQLKSDLVGLDVTLTRAQPPGWDGLSGRVDRTMLERVAPQASPELRTYVCGPTPFVEAVAEQLVALGHDPANVLTERFGPTGG